MFPAGVFDGLPAVAAAASGRDAGRRLLGGRAGRISAMCAALAVLPFVSGESSGGERRIPMTVGELLRRSHEALDGFASLHVVETTDRAGTVRVSEAWLRRDKAGEKPSIRAEVQTTNEKESKRQVFLRAGETTWRILGDRALELKFPARLPGIGVLPPTYREYQRILRNPVDLRHYEIEQPAEMRGQQCYRLVYRLPDPTGSQLQREADRIKKSRVDAAVEAGATEEDLILIEEIDFLASVRNAKVTVQVFYINATDFFTVGWEYYNSDGEQLNQKFYDRYELNAELPQDLFAVAPGKEKVVVETKEAYQALLDSQPK